MISGQFLFVVHSLQRDFPGFCPFPGAEYFLRVSEQFGYSERIFFIFLEIPPPPPRQHIGSFQYQKG
jgi:hypothetical protein